MAGTKNIHKESQGFQFAGRDLKLDYTLASFAYLTEKYGDLGELFSLISSKGKSVSDMLSSKFLHALADMIYAGLMRCDPDKLENGASFKEADTSGWNPSKIFTSIRLADIGSISQAIQGAMDGAMPDANPTNAANKAAQ